MFLSSFSIRRPVAMTALLAVFLLFGALAYRRLGLDLIPTVDVPYVTVVTAYPGASPREIESEVARRIEDAVSLIEGVKRLDSICMEGVCQTVIEFHLGRDVDLAAMDVREKVDAIRAQLPDGAEAPAILKFDINAIPVVTLALAGDRPLDELYELADTQVKDAFSAIPGVANVELSGGATRELDIELDPDRLAAAGLTAPQVLARLAEGNLKIPAGHLSEADREWAVTMDAEARTVEEVEAFELIARDGRRVRLGDVALVRLASREARTVTFHDGQPCVTLQIIKRSDANAVQVIRRARRVYEELRAALPGGADLRWVRDDGRFIEASVADAWGSIGLGLTLTGLLLLLFLADWRLAAISFLSLPASIVITFAAMRWMGDTLNSVTLLALGVSVGTLVTNSIVVLESIEARRAKGGGLREAVEGGAADVAIPVAASAGTNVIVFVPIAMMASIVGRIFAPFAMTIAAATLVSLWVSFTMTPILAAAWLGRFERITAALAAGLAPFERGVARLGRAYAGSLRRLARWRGAVIAATAAALVLVSGIVAPRLGMDFMPEMDRGEFSVRLEFPTDRNLDDTARRAHELAGRIRRFPWVRTVLVRVGKVQGVLGRASEGPYLAEIVVQALPKTERQESLEDLRQALRDVAAAEPACETSVLVVSPVGGATKPFEVNLWGPDRAALDELARRAAARLAATGLARDIEHTVRVGKPELQVRPDRAAFNDMDLTERTAGFLLRTQLEGTTISTFKAGDRAYDIRVRMRRRTGVEQVAETALPTPDGAAVPLGAVARVEPSVTPIQLTRSGKRPVAKVFANLAPGVSLEEARAAFDREVRPMLPAGFGIEYTGMVEMMQEAGADFAEALLVAVALLYLLLAAMLESWTQPLLVLTTLPLGFMGLVLAYAAAGMSLSVFGMLAGVMLVGIVVNNAILVVDAANVLIRRDGVPRFEAILRAAAEEFRPIAMISLASVLGMVPMAFGRGLGSEVRAACGIGVFGGLIFASLISLYLVPLIYLAVTRRRPSAS